MNLFASLLPASSKKQLIPYGTVIRPKLKTKLSSLRKRDKILLSMSAGAATAIGATTLETIKTKKVSPIDFLKNVQKFILGIIYQDVCTLNYLSKKASADISNNFKYESKYNPYTDGLPDSVQQELADKYESIFKLLLKHENVIERATFWGLNDEVSWKNNFPVKGRTNYPLLFDRNNDPKPAYDAVIQLVK